VVVAMQHQVILSWTASISPVTGYNVYRGTQTGGPYTLLNTDTVTADTFTDATVVSGQTYFYVVTAVNSSGVESVFSNEAAAVIPAP
jgi:fibronectin type 3 domain-containing protein